MRRFLERSVLLSIVPLISLAWTDSGSAFAQERKVVIPHAQDKPPNEPRDPQTAAKMMTVPEGFSVEVVAAEPDIVNPVAMTIDERGRFWITESLEYPRKAPGPGKDRVKILEDTDGDGKMDKFTVFLDGLNIPSGIAVGHGGVWIANSPDILFVPDADRDGKPDGPPQVVVTGFGRTDTHELPNSLTWGPDGWLYGLNGVFNFSKVTYPKDSPWLKQMGQGTEKTQGTKGDAAKDSSNSPLATRHSPLPTEFTFTCAMFRIHPRTWEFQVFAEGTSNPWGIAFNDEGEAFVSACVIDHLWHIVETGYYHRQGGPYPPFTWKIDSIVKHKHQKAAYCGIHYFDSDAYPEQYCGKLYMGNIHGGCINVDKLQRDGSTYFATGEPDLLTANDAWFMPVVQKTGPDGCLYILDWYDRYHCYQDANRDPAGIDRLKGRLYRVRYNGKPGDAATGAAKAGAANAVRSNGAPETSPGQASATSAALGHDPSNTIRPERATDRSVTSTTSRAPSGHNLPSDTEPRAALPLVGGPGLISKAPAGQTAIAGTNVVAANLAAPAAVRVYPQIDLAKETDEQLIERLGANNDFIRWTATRLLQERIGGQKHGALGMSLEKVIRDSDARQSAKMHAVFAMIGGGNEPTSNLVRWANVADQQVRSWLLRYAADEFHTMPILVGNASPSVLLQTVIAIGKTKKEWGIKTMLDVLTRSGDDKLIPHVVWQNLHPLLENHSDSLLRQLESGGYLKEKPVADLMPRVVDRILGRQKFDAQPIGKLFALLRDDQPQVGREVLAVLAAKVQSGELKGDKLEQLKTAMFEPLTPLLNSGVSHPLGGDAALLAVSWGDPRALPHARRSFTTAGLQPDLRLKALSALISAKDEELLKSVESVLEGVTRRREDAKDNNKEAPPLRASAPSRETIAFASQLLTTIGRLEDPKIASLILTRYATFEPELQPSAIELLTQRANWSKQLLSQVGEKKIAATAINVNQARRIQALKDKELNDLLSRHWGQVRDTRNPDREKVVAEMKSLIRQKPGDPFAGEKVFKRVCAACHKIYGEGPDIGPDITSNGRNDFNQLLSNVFDPSLVIGAGYRVCTVVNKAGRVQSGLLVEDSPQRVVLKPAAIAPVKSGASDAPVTVAVGKLEIIPRDDIDEFKINELSLMPEGLEKQLTPQEIVDLFAFLTLDKHPNDKSAKRLPGAGDVQPKQSTKPDEFGAIVNEILPGFTTNAAGEGGVAVLSEYWGRKDVLRTHPVSREAPCVLTRTVQLPAGQRTRLLLDVCHQEQYHNWRLVVRGNGERLFDEIIGKEPYRYWCQIPVDLTKFAGQEVKIDLVNQANDWDYEFAYWRGAKLVSDPFTSRSNREADPTGRTKLELSEREAKLIETESGRVIFELSKAKSQQVGLVERRNLRIMPFTYPIRCWAFSPDGKFLAIGCGRSDNPYPVENFKFSYGGFRVFDTQTGEVLAGKPEPFFDGFIDASPKSVSKRPEIPITAFHRMTGGTLNLEHGVGEVSSLFFDDQGLKIEARKLEIDGK